MIIKVKVYLLPGKQKIIKKGLDEYEVYLKSRAENNKANVEMIKMLNKYFGKEIRIKSGKTSRRKIVEVK